MKNQRHFAETFSNDRYVYHGGGLDTHSLEFVVRIQYMVDNSPMVSGLQQLTHGHVAPLRHRPHGPLETTKGYKNI